jgi:peptidoglycan/xylan/chitin deacetylase (PgdA/CDA1 family)
VTIANTTKLRLQRLVASRLHRKPAVQRTPAPIVSFTFDDFPRSALNIAGAMLSDQRVRGTYYVSAGLMAKETVMGEMFSRNDLSALVEAGHELACHTFEHVRCCDTRRAGLLDQCEANRRSVADLLHGYELRNFSFPEGVVNSTAKLAVSSVYDTCRTIEPGINGDPVDLGFLRANCMYSRVPLETLRKAIQENVRRRGWLILYTHDVAATPSVYGCTPEYFRGVLSAVLDSGASVLTVAEARERFVANPRNHLKDTAHA